jgi:ABC-type Mn2+/Zn2+ transport system permease subunit
MKHRKPPVHTKHHTALNVLYALVFATGVIWGYVSGLGTAAMVFALALGLFCGFGALYTQNTKPLAATALITIVEATALGITLGVGLHLHIAPLFS